jgi:hypothetical protein
VDGEAQVDPAATPSSPAFSVAVLPPVTPLIAPRGPPIPAQHDPVHSTTRFESPPSRSTSPNSFLLPSREVSPVQSLPPSRAVSPIPSSPEQPLAVARTLPSAGRPALTSSTLIDVVAAALVNPTNEGMDVDQVIGGIPTRGANPGRGRNRGVRAKARVSDGRGTARDQTKSSKRKGGNVQGEGQNAKRQRKGNSAEDAAVSSSSPATAIIPPLPTLSSLASRLPDNAPTWVPLALEFLESKVPSKVSGEGWTDLGEKWSHLVSTWLSLEIGAGFSSSTKLGTSKRPSCISDWIQRARTPTFRPNISDIHKFESNFLAWWTSLQPKWRHHDGELLRTGGNDWEPLRRTGINGLLSVLAALFFWRYAIGKGETAAWEGSLDDVAWALRGLTEL